MTIPRRSAGVRTAATASLLMLSIAGQGLGQVNEWTEVTGMPTARLGLATSVVDDTLFAIGGYPIANQAGLSTVEAL